MLFLIKHHYGIFFWEQSIAFICGPHSSLRTNPKLYHPELFYYPFKYLTFQYTLLFTDKHVNKLEILAVNVSVALDKQYTIVYKIYS